MIFQLLGLLLVHAKSPIKKMNSVKLKKVDDKIYIKF